MSVIKVVQLPHYVAFSSLNAATRPTKAPSHQPPPHAVRQHRQQISCRPMTTTTWLRPGLLTRPREKYTTERRALVDIGTGLLDAVASSRSNPELATPKTITVYLMMLSVLFLVHSRLVYNTDSTWVKTTTGAQRVKLTPAWVRRVMVGWCEGETRMKNAICHSTRHWNNLNSGVRFTGALI